MIHEFIMATVRQCIIPPEAYPRYVYTCTHVRRLNRRCQKLNQKCGIQDSEKLPSFGNVVINIHSADDTVLIEDHNLVYKPVSEESIQTNTFPLAEITKKKRKLQIDTGSSGAVKNPTISVASYTEARKDGKDLPDYFGKLIILISDNTHDTANIEDLYIFVVTRDEFKVAICNILERYVFRYLKIRADMLRFLLGSSNSPGYASSLSRFFTPQSKVLDTPIKMPGSPNLSSVYRRTQTNSTSEESLPETFDGACSVQSEDSKRLDILNVDLSEHVELVEHQKQQIKELLTEIIAMFRRSNVPEAQHPKAEKILPRIDQCIASSLFNTVPEVTDIGYRFGTLNVFIESSQDPMDETAKNIISKKVASFFKYQGIEDESYVLRFGLDEIRNFSEFEVGCKVKVDTTRSGTLGGFALKGEAKRTCALLARHVTDGASTLLLACGGNTTEIGTILTPRQCRPLRVDISAAEIHEHLVELHNTQLKNIRGIRTRSEVYDFGDSGPNDLERIENFLCGLPVHIWGASSMPGKGKIVIGHLFRKKLTSIGCVAIEDIESESGDSDDDDASSRVFSKSGDSGAIVCADDQDQTFVHAISMLMGVGKQSDNGKALYLSFKLQEGLTQLEFEHDDTFDLC